MAKHIGIVACSAEGAALCYQTICRESAEHLGEHFHPEVSMHTFSLGEYMIPIRKGDWQQVARMMSASATKLSQTGAELLICPDNTIHEAFAFLVLSHSYQWLHIAEVVATSARESGYSKLGILGTKFLMEGPVYPDILAKFEITHIIPEENVRKTINKKIFSELVKGIFTESTRLYFNEVIDDLRQQGCDAVVLGCTEIPLIVDPEDCPLPVLDSTRLLARAAIRHSLE